MSYYKLGLFSVCAGLVIVGCGDDGGSGGSPSGGSPAGGNAQGAGSQGGDGPVAGSSEGGAAQGGAAQGGAAQGGAAQGGAGQGGAGQGGDGSGGAAPLTCQTGCQALFDCGLENGSNGQPNCPGFEPADGALFVPGCVQQCMNNMGLLGLIDPADCEETIATVSGINAQFANFCQQGL